jgi:outer membrane lipoprotein-sorting protein
MKPFLICLFIFTACTAAAQPEAALVKAVKAKLDKVKDYKASGKMKIDVTFINAPESEVTVYYKRPDKFAVKKQNGISILPKGGVSVNINSLLFTDNYTVVPAGAAVVKGFATKVVKLLPLDDAGDVVLTTLYIDEKALLIRRSSVTTKESGSYEMELDYGRYAAYGLPDKVVFLFNAKDYKLPKGLTFEYEKGGKKPAETSKDKKGRVAISYSNYTINQGISDAVFASK